VDRFIGRTGELKTLDAWWASESPVLFVTGLAGIGKSALVAAWIQGRQVRVPVYGFETRPSSTAAGLLADFGGFLAALGKPGLAAHLAQGVPLDLAFVSRLLGRDLADGRTLVVLDNADQASRDVTKLISGLFLRMSRDLRVKVVLLGRRLPRWLDASTEGAREPEILHLRGLDPGASMALLRSRGLGPDSSTAQEIVRTTRGHPLLLHLAASTGTGRGAAVQRYLEEEVWGSLSTTDRSVLQAASVFRRPVSEHILEEVAETDHPALESLTERNLLERTIAGGYLMHDLVRGFVTAQVSGARRRTLHARAAERLLRAADSRERWEGVYHLLEAGQSAEAAMLLDSEGSPLLDCVAAEDIASLVHGLTLDETQAGTYCVFAEVLGDSLRVRGHVGPALFQYGHARKLSEGARRFERVPRLLRKMAFLERCRNAYPKALGYLVESRARLLEMNNSAEMTEVLREMALAEQALGNLDQAARHLSEAVDLATESSDRAALSRTLLALGSLQLQQGHVDQGLESNLEGLRVAERSGNLTEVAHAHIVVGATLTGAGRGAESLRHYADGFETARLLGNLRLMAYATMNQTNALLQLHRYEEAGVTLRLAMDYFEILEEKDTLGFLKTYEGELELRLGHWSRATHAWQEGIADLRVHGSPADLALVLREVAGFYSEQDKRGESQSYLLEAREIAGRVGNRELLSKIESDLQILRSAPTQRSRR